MSLPRPPVSLFPSVSPALLFFWKVEPQAEILRSLFLG